MKEKNRRDSLYRQVKIARFWLPVAIVLMVLFFHFVILASVAPAQRDSFTIIFYALLGPTVTFLTLNWLAQEIKNHEKAKYELEHLYQELQTSHELLSSIQEVTEQFASAANLEATIAVASRGITDVTKALGVAVCLSEGNMNIDDQYNLSSALFSESKKRTSALAHNQSLNDKITLTNTDYWVLTNPILWAEKLVGGVHAYYETKPTDEQKESFSILSSEFSASAEAIRGRTRDLLTLIEIDRSIKAEGNLERILEILLKQMMARVDASIGGIFLLGDANRLVLRAGQGIAGTIEHLKLGEGFIGQTALEEKPRLSWKLEAKFRLGMLEHAQSAIALPFLADGLLGVVVLAHEKENYFYKNSLAFLSLMTGQLTLAIKNAQSYLQSEELAVSEERRRIAREIHDGVAQTLAFSALQLDLVNKLIEKDSEKAISKITDIKSTLRELIKELRRSIFALRPVDLDSHGLAETVRRYCRDYGEQNDVKVDVNIERLPKLSKKLEITVFRIFQEAMHNVAKHARANNINISLIYSSNGNVELNIIDDGQGFDLASVSDRVTTAGGLGLKNMQERVEKLGGSFSIKSQKGQGTSIKTSIPV
ncbi:MAG TPA: hypothetical protein ENK21_06925 [Trueperaceae bacterium]|nr:hypothetical protein [Trueperaceae bacterium]